REAWAAERVEAGGEHRADAVETHLEALERLHGLVEQLELDVRRALLKAGRKEVLPEVQLAPLDAAAGEDALGELVTGEAELLERLALRHALAGVEHGKARERRHAAQGAGKVPA